MILDANGREVREPARIATARVRAGFDAARMGGPHAKHWSNADHLSPDAAANPSVRRTLRSRCRYEIANNSYAAGIVSTLANYVVGTGPTLRLVPKATAGKRAKDCLTRLQELFNGWAWDAGLARALHVMQLAKAGDGEGFALLLTRPGRRPNQVTLGLRTFEAELCARPHDFTRTDLDQPEGIDLDEAGEPKTYHLLKRHPGSGALARYGEETIPVPAAYVCHWFDENRPGLHRGLPEVLPALPLFAQLRRYVSAVVTAAEAAADISGILYTDAPPGDEDAVDAGSTFELERGFLVSAPHGWKMGQVKSEHPGAQHDPFLRCIIRELGRCIDMPYAVAAMDASGHNYSSMRGDWQAFFQAIRWRRFLCEQQVLDKVLAAWMAEARLALGITPPAEYDYVWDWPAVVPADPVKEAQARVILLKARLTNYAREYAAQALNWEQELRQTFIEESMVRDAGMAPITQTPGTDPAPDANEREDGEA